MKDKKWLKLVHLEEKVTLKKTRRCFKSIKLILADERIYLQDLKQMFNTCNNMGK